jgi:3-oxoadipate enol-lactonase
MTHSLSAHNGAALRVVDEGRGTPLLLVHGFPLDGALWDAQREALADHCRVIVPDLQGCGFSDLARDVCTMESHARDLAAVLDHLGEDSAVVAGLSMGGYVALSFARLFPQRLLGLGLINTRAVADTADARANRERMARRALAEGAAAIAEEMLPKLLGPEARSDAETVALVLAVMERQRPAGVAAQLRGMAERPDSRELLPDILVPSLVLTGEADNIAPVSEAREMAAALPDAELVVVPRAGHLTPLEAPDAVCAALRRLLARVQGVGCGA